MVIKECSQLIRQKHMYMEKSKDIIYVKEKIKCYDIIKKLFSFDYFTKEDMYVIYMLKIYLKQNINY